MRIVNYQAMVLLTGTLSVLLAPLACLGQGSQPPLVPPNSSAFGKTFEEWNVLQTEWAIATGLGGATNLDDTIGRVRLLPGDFFNPTPVFNITLSPGTPFVAPAFFLFGERFDDPGVPDDDPQDPGLAEFVELVLTTTDITVELDGRVVLKGKGDELKAYRFGPEYFEAPIAYAEPQPRAPGLNAVAALWTVGFGTVYHPLPVGRHTLVYHVSSPNFSDTDFTFTYNITVKPK